MRRGNGGRFLGCAGWVGAGVRAATVASIVRGGGGGFSSSPPRVAATTIAPAARRPAARPPMKLTWRRTPCPSAGRAAPSRSALVLERDVQAHPVARDAPLLDGHILPSHLGDAQVAHRLAGR